METSYARTSMVLGCWLTAVCGDPADCHDQRQTLLHGFHLWSEPLNLRSFSFAYPELRLRVSANRYRIPDVCVFLERPQEQVPSTPPVLIIEILSPEDRFGPVQARLDDFSTMGCPCAWVLDPQARKALRFDGAVQVPAAEELGHPMIAALRLPVADVFARL